MMILYVTRDLMLGSRVKSHAQELGVELHLQPQLPDAHNLDPQVTRCLLDLETCKESLASWLEALGDRRATLQLVGYAPHVQESTLAAATLLGLNQVMTRGQFNHAVEELLT